MKDRLSKKAVLIEALTIVLLTYVGYRIYQYGCMQLFPLDVFRL